MVVLPRPYVPTVFDPILHFIVDLITIYLLMRLALLIVKALWMLCRLPIRPYFEPILYREEVLLRWKYRRLSREGKLNSPEWDSLRQEAWTTSRMNSLFGFESHPAVAKIYNTARAVKLMRSPQILS